MFTDTKAEHSNIKPQNKKERPQRQKKLPKKISETYLHNSGLYYLQRFSASSGHFKTVMERKIKKSCHAHPEQNYEECIAMLEGVVDKFISSGLLNDGVYGANMVASMRRKGLSKRSIQQKLGAKGLPPNDILQHLSDYDQTHSKTDEETELQAAVKICRKKRIGPYAKVTEDDDTYRKSLAKLARAGFSFQICQKALNATDDEDLLF